MNINQAEIMLRFGWEITRKKWDNEKRLKKIANSNDIEVLYENGKTEKYIPTQEDTYALDWKISEIQSEVKPTLTE